MRVCTRCKHSNADVLLKERGRYVKDEYGDTVKVKATKCEECGCNMNRPCRKRPGRHKVGGKRGRNSGKVKQHGKKGG